VPRQAPPRRIAQHLLPVPALALLRQTARQPQERAPARQRARPLLAQQLV